MVLDVEFNPILTELWPWEGPKLKPQKCSKWICFFKILLLFLALFCHINHKIVFKNYLTRFPRFLAFQNCPWSSEFDKIHGSESKFKFLFQNEGFQFDTWRLSQSKMKFSFCCYSHELYPILIVRDSSGNLRTWGKGSI